MALQQLRKRGELRWRGVRVNGFNTVHWVNWATGRPRCNVSVGGGADAAFELTEDVPGCKNRGCGAPADTKAQKMYLQGWRNGTKGEIKKGPANQKDDALRAAYLEGFEHGSGDKANAEFHGSSRYGPR